LLTTTQSNISEFQISIPIHKLSRVFQDVLLVTNGLGFEYIWIDSLCIVQDDVADWMREALLRGDVYRNASCNISASAFASGEEGFVLARRRLDPTPVFLKADIDPSIFTWSQGDNIYGFMYQYPLEETMRGALFRRAWTFQEQLLVGPKRLSAIR
jgi:hypothetical protein